jgi:hypothetical protein
VMKHNAASHGEVSGSTAMRWDLSFRSFRDIILNSLIRHTAPATMPVVSRMARVVVPDWSHHLTQGADRRQRGPKKMVTAS